MTTTCTQIEIPGDQEAIGGESLTTRLHRTGPLALEEAAPIIEQVLRVLARVHGAGAVIGHVQPGQICISADGELRWAIVRSCVRAPGLVAPERVGVTDGVQASLWETTAMAYLVLFGRVPFAGTDERSRRAAQQEIVVVPTECGKHEVSPQLIAWFRRGLAFREEDRFASADEMLEGWRCGVQSTLAGIPVLHGDYEDEIPTRISPLEEEPPSRPEAEEPTPSTAPMIHERTTPEPRPNKWLYAVGVAAAVLSASATSWLSSPAPTAGAPTPICPSAPAAEPTDEGVPAVASQSSHEEAPAAVESADDTKIGRPEEEAAAAPTSSVAKEEWQTAQEAWRRSRARRANERHPYEVEDARESE